jgi:D-alanyl-lipoteichoic acid acyltransferase DltB (MBOAT superfamily)
MRARSLQEFWRRWHVTLSRWLRDYLYIPLGGSRHGSLRTAVSLNLTMLLGGLWHGAGLNFVVWGAMHGIGLTVERAFGRRGGWLLGWLACQLWVTLAWVMFRAPSVRSGVDFIAAMFAPGSVSALVPHMTILQLLPLTVPALLHHVAPLSCYRLHGVKRAVAIGVLTGAMLVVLLLMPSSRALFIYFKF